MRAIGEGIYEIVKKGEKFFGDIGEIEKLAEEFNEEER